MKSCQFWRYRFSKIVLAAALIPDIHGLPSEWGVEVSQLISRPFIPKGNWVVPIQPSSSSKQPLLWYCNMVSDPCHRCADVTAEVSHVPTVTWATEHVKILYCDIFEGLFYCRLPEQRGVMILELIPMTFKMCLRKKKLLDTRDILTSALRYYNSGFLQMSPSFFGWDPFRLCLSKISPSLNRIELKSRDLDLRSQARSNIAVLLCGYPMGVSISPKIRLYFPQAFHQSAG